jgi:uncharacterized membrane protein HdeD (DUF308 family)
MLAVLIAAGAATICVSMILWWTANRAGLWMLFWSVALTFAVLGGAVAIGWLLTRGYLRP